MTLPAWLDNLSEDWPSQPVSEAELLSRKSSQLVPSGYDSRRNVVFADQDGSSIALNQRSPSQINIPVVTHRATKYSRSVSPGSSGSVVHNTCHRSENVSPTKGDTPDWKRRLIQGKLDAGEQLDLFASACTGLELMFHPPAPNIHHISDHGEYEEEEEEGRFDHVNQNDITIPSSPPAYAVYPDDELDPPDQGSPSVIRQQRRSARKTREITLKLVDSKEPSRNSNLGIHESVEDTRVNVGMPEPKPSSFSEIPVSALSHAATSSSAPAPASNSVAPLPVGDSSRQASSQSVVRNEDLTPIVISPIKDRNGRVVFAPMTGLPATQLRSKLEKLRSNQMLLDSYAEDGEEKVTGNAESTDELVRLGTFINCQRGGRSTEGSFRHRLLSPSDTSDMLPEDSLQASTPKQFPSMRREISTKSPVIPAAPYPSPEKGDTARTSLGGVASLGSLRAPSLKVPQPHQPHWKHCGVSAELESALTSDSKSPQAPHSELYPGHDTSANEFGCGKLEGYQFWQEVSCHSNSDETELGETDKENRSPENTPASPGPRAKIKFDPTALNKYDFSVTSPSEGSGLLVHATPKQFDTGSDSKRPHSSPSKNPTPKRRRTLHESDVAYSLDHCLESRISSFDSVQNSHQRIQSALGRKRKDARHGDLQQRATPDVLASRTILRPRNPTPRASLLWESRAIANIPATGEESNLGDQSAVSDASAMFAAPVRTPRTAARKPSIKTQDFLDEAEKIMAMIRNKARPAGLSSVEESEGENRSAQVENTDSVGDSSVEPFSRPPSRDGRPPIPQISNIQCDPKLAQRLQKYEERSDMGDLVMSSLRYLGRAKDHAMAPAATVEGEIKQQIERATATQHSGPEIVIASDPPNIRITSNLHPQSKGPELLTKGSHGSSHSSSRSVPSTSSKASESCKTIPPQNISHLIPDQVGNMILDRDQNLWIKQKRSAMVPKAGNVLLSEDSEDDPFASIPDLTVDMTLEMRNLRLSHTKRPLAAGETSFRTAETPSPTCARSRSTYTLKSSLRKPLSRSPLYRERQPTCPLLPNNETLLEHDKEVEHEINVNEDRIKSSPPRKTISFSSPIASIISDVAGGDDDESQANGTPSQGLPLNDITKQSTKWARFGSTSGIPRPKANPKGSARRKCRYVSTSATSFFPRRVSRIEECSEGSTSTRRKSSLTEDLSAVVPKEKAVIEAEEGHDGQSALVPINKADTSVSIVVTPAANRIVSCPLRANPAPVIGQYVGTLSLSPLSEFTLNNPDQSLGLEVSYLVRDHRLVTGDGDKKILSMALRDLVSRIAEVAPFEPHWEDLKDLMLARKSLATLHKLDQFCGSLVTLDASQNSLSQLDGVPPSVRHLKVTDNRLSELTGWGHLLNLQYLDVSNNELTNLSALRGLVHLRDVKADNNQITSLSDLIFHDGIQSLRARGNLIDEIDFEGTSMHRLVDLDLENNCISSVRCIQSLKGLASLNLQHNRITEFKSTRSKSFQSLKYVKLSDNELQSIDVGDMPSLRLLHADRNNINNITGFNRTRHLDSISLREQKTESLEMSFLSQCCEVRKLFLSGNLLASFDLGVDFLNLQYLEIANCGFESLPEHLGWMCPNLRVLNANFNALSDLRPLTDIPRLKKLLLAGNRIDMDKARLVSVLAEFPHLRVLDLRSNPLSLGFYPPPHALTKVCDKVADSGKANEPCPFELPDSDPGRDRRFVKRLDMQTRMRRRLYEIILASACLRLQVLDGLSINRDAINFRDAVWQGLRDKGLVRVDKSPVLKVSNVTNSSHGEKSSSKKARKARNIPEQRDFTVIEEDSRGTLEALASKSRHAQVFPGVPGTSPNDALDGFDEKDDADEDKYAKGEESSRWRAEDSFGG